MSDQTTCQGTTKSGEPCGNAAGDDGYCYLESHGPSATDDLSIQQRRFVEEYCVDFNASGAARRAGYSEKTAGQQGHRLLKNVEIMGAISKRLEHMGMSAAEATSRMTDMARADFRYFTSVSDDGRVRIDLTTPEAQAMMHVIKKVKQTERRFGEDGAIIEFKTEVELHDAKDALHKILQAHGAYTERVDVTSDGDKVYAVEFGTVRRDDD
ncbi:MAG: terminase small subunit [Persicimonas sp.]